MEKYSLINNDRDILYKLWCDYNSYAKKVQSADVQIKEIKQEILNQEYAIKVMQKEIDDNKRILETNGECLRPKENSASSTISPIISIISGFALFVPLFIGLTIAAFVGMLVMIGISPETVEGWAESLNVLAGLFVWLGSPVIGAIGAVGISLLIGIISVFVEIKAWKRKKDISRRYDPTNAINKASAFMNNIDSYNEEKNKKERKLNELRTKHTEIINCKKNLSPVENNLRMPDELKNMEGTALLIGYIDKGRADTLQEAINLYYQELKDSVRIAELRKQTQYAQQQMINSQIAAENSRIAAENTRKTLEATNRAAQEAERAADNAATAADYERKTYWDNIYYNSKK